MLILFRQANGTKLHELTPCTTPATSARSSTKTFPFDQTLQALAYFEQGRANGKVVITLD